MLNFSKEKFLSLKPYQRHKHLAKLLKEYYIHTNIQALSQYQKMLSWLGQDVAITSKEQAADLYHSHLNKAGIQLREHAFLPQLDQLDSPSSKPFLPITIYLDQLRLAQNIGSIIRTTEAFRLGNIFFSENTPFIDEKKVQDSSMGTYKIVDCHRDIHRVIRPIIALETIEEAQDLEEFIFPREFTLMVGNEEYGISKKNLSHADHCIRIPLPGQKNSINVACAFAIVANKIHSQHNIKNFNV